MGRQKGPCLYKAYKPEATMKKLYHFMNIVYIIVTIAAGPASSIYVCVTSEKKIYELYWKAGSRVWFVNPVVYLHSYSQNRGEVTKKPHWEEFFHIYLLSIYQDTVSTHPVNVYESGPRTRRNMMRSQKVEYSDWLRNALHYISPRVCLFGVSHWFDNCLRFPLRKPTCYFAD